MHVDHTPTQKALRAELRAYFAKLVPPEVRTQIRALEGGPLQRRLIQQMGADGWLGVGWPREWGGQGRTAIEQQIWFEEARRAGAPLPFVTLNTVGPALIARGSEAQKRRFLPGILAGEIHFAIGYTEPGAGTDLAALETRAVREGDVFVVNGTKIFTSGADDADYIWLACRTDPGGGQAQGHLDPDRRYEAAGLLGDANPHAGRRPHDDDLLRERARAGGDAGGRAERRLEADHAAAQPRAHRTRRASARRRAQRFDEVLAWARATTDEAGQPVARKPWVQIAFAEAWARLEAQKVWNWRIAWELEQGRLEPARASAAKVYSLRDADRGLPPAARRARRGRARCKTGSPGARAARPARASTGAAARSTPSAAA